MTLAFICHFRLFRWKTEQVFLYQEFRFVNSKKNWANVSRQRLKYLVFYFISDLQRKLPLSKMEHIFCIQMTFYDITYFGQNKKLLTYQTCIFDYLDIKEVQISQYIRNVNWIRRLLPILSAVSANLVHFLFTFSIKPLPANVTSCFNTMRSIYNPRSYSKCYSDAFLLFVSSTRK